MVATTEDANASAIRLSRRLRTLYGCHREFFQAQNELELLPVRLRDSCGGR
jgi:hypothetical protein